MGRLREHAADEVSPFRRERAADRFFEVGGTRCVVVFDGGFYVVPTDCARDFDPEYPIGPLKNLRAAVRLVRTLERMGRCE